MIPFAWPPPLDSDAQPAKEALPSLYQVYEPGRAGKAYTALLMPYAAAMMAAREGWIVEKLKV